MWQVSEITSCLSRKRTGKWNILVLSNSYNCKAIKQITSVVAVSNTMRTAKSKQESRARFKLRASPLIVSCLSTVVNRNESARVRVHDLFGGVKVCDHVMQLRDARIVRAGTWSRYCGSWFDKRKSHIFLLSPFYSAYCADVEIAVQTRFMQLLVIHARVHTRAHLVYSKNCILSLERNYHIWRLNHFFF